MRPITLRGTFVALGLTAVAYVVGMVVVVSSTAIRETEAIATDIEGLAREFDGLGARAAALDSAVAVLTRAIQGIEEPGQDLAYRWAAEAEDRAIVAALALTGLPTSLRKDLAVAADLESELNGLLNEGLAQHRLGNQQAATATVARVRQIRDRLNGLLISAQREGMRVLLDRQMESATMAANLRALVLVWLAVAVVLSIATLVWLHMRFYGPLVEIEAGLARVGSGDYRSRIPVRRTDELGRLARVVNETTDRLMARADEQARHTRTLSERLGHLLADSSNEIYVFGSGDFGIVQMNDTALANLQLSEADAVGLTPLDFLPDRTPEQLTEELRPLVSGSQKHVSVKGHHRRTDGTTYPFDGSIQYSSAEDPPVFVAIVRDVSVALEREERLRQAQKLEAVGQLTGGVAHDFNNLLTVISGSLELMEEAACDSADRELIREAASAAQKGAALTHQLLAFSRKQPLRPEPVDANHLLSDMDGMLRRTLGEHIEIEFRRVGGLWKSEVDRVQLQNVVLNLAINARDAMPQGGTLTIEARNYFLDRDRADPTGELSAGHYVMIGLTDTGIGMSPETQERAFEPFFTTKETGKGSGLGLSMVFGFAKQSAGHVRILSEPGKGTTVRLYLPRFIEPESDNQVDADAHDADGTPMGSGQTILVVEDDTSVRRLATQLLRQLGYIPTAAVDAHEALEILDERNGNPFDVLFSDVVLPGGMTGLDLAEEVRARSPETRVLFTSGYTPEAVMKGNWVTNDTVLLKKPYTRLQLAEEIRAALEDARA